MAIIENLGCYEKAQDMARATMRHLRHFIRQGMSESEIANEADEQLRIRGSGGTWYYDCHALVLVGERTTRSVSGRDYMRDPESVVGFNDLVTIDLSPTYKGCWGDFARSIIISGGSCSERKTIGKTGIMAELWEGVQVEEEVHQCFLEYAHPAMTFDDIYNLLSWELENLGYINLDFKGNFGHTIEDNLDSRRYILPGNVLRLRDAGLFTIEPHICLKAGDGMGQWGYKREDIYYYSADLGRIVKL